MALFSGYQKIQDSPRIVKLSSSRSFVSSWLAKEGCSGNTIANDAYIALEENYLKKPTHVRAILNEQGDQYLHFNLGSKKYEIPLLYEKFFKE